MWKFFQAAIFCAVMWSDYEYKWSVGPYWGPIMAVAAAWLFTAVISDAVDLTRRARLKKAAEKASGGGVG